MLTAPPNPRNSPSPDTAQRGPAGAAVFAACDWAERLVVLAVYVGLVVRMLWPAGGEIGLTNLLLLPSEGLVVIFLLIRRPTTSISIDWREWSLALTATLVPMLVRPSASESLVPPAVAATLYLSGLIVQMHAKWVLGRSFGCVPANRGLKLTGPYRIVRHPMYAGYLLGHLAFLLMNPTLWNAGVYACAYALQIPRLLAEERLLREDPGYQNYLATVRYRLIPRVF